MTANEADVLSVIDDDDEKEEEEDGNPNVVNGAFLRLQCPLTVDSRSRKAVEFELHIFAKMDVKATRRRRVNA